MRPAGLVAAIVAADAALASDRLPRPAAGVVDEAAHAALGALVARRLGGGADFTAGVYAGSIALDADHVPDALGHDWLRANGNRPFPHSVVTVLLPLLAGGRRRGLLHGVAVGVAFHLLRDLATPPGVGIPALWPFSHRRYTLPYAAYLGALLLLATHRCAVHRG